MAKQNALQRVESHEKLCRIMQKLTHKKIHQIEERVKRLEKISKRYGIKNPLTTQIKRKIRRLRRKLKKQKLNKPYILEHEEKYLFPEKKDQPQMEGLLKTQAPPLGPTPQPSKLLSQQPQVDPITNLTPSETALLSPTEKVIAGRT